MPRRPASPGLRSSTSRRQLGRLPADAGALRYRPRAPRRPRHPAHFREERPRRAVPHILKAFQRARRASDTSALRALAHVPRIVEAVDRLDDWDFITSTGIQKGYDPFDDPFDLPAPAHAEIRSSVAATIYSVWRGRGPAGDRRHPWRAWASVTSVRTATWRWPTSVISWRPSPRPRVAAPRESSSSPPRRREPAPGPRPGPCWRAWMRRSTCSPARPSRRPSKAPRTRTITLGQAPPHRLQPSAGRGVQHPAARRTSASGAGSGPLPQLRRGGCLRGYLRAQRSRGQRERVHVRRRSGAALHRRDDAPGSGGGGGDPGRRKRRPGEPLQVDQLFLWLTNHYHPWLF